jgi:hypothetical protein
VQHGEGLFEAACPCGIGRRCLGDPRVFGQRTLGHGEGVVVVDHKATSVTRTTQSGKTFDGYIDEIDGECWLHQQIIQPSGERNMGCQILDDFVVVACQPQSTISSTCR